MVVFQGHHGSFNAANADLVLPSTAPFEKSSCFYDCARFVGG